MGSLPVVLLTLLAPTAPLVARPDVVEYAGRGFRLTVPDGWKSQPAQSGDVWTLYVVPEGRPNVYFTVRTASAADEADPAARRDAASEHVRELYGPERIDPVTVELAGREAPGLRSVFSIGEITYRCEHYVLVEGDGALMVEHWAPPELFDELEPAFAAMRASFELVEPTAEVLEERRLAALVERATAELPWADSWAEAAKRAREEEKLVMVLAAMYGGFAIGDADVIAAFHDPDVTALVRERYVPFRLHKGTKVPFEDPELYGLGPNSFGSGLLLVTPDGEVLRDGWGEPMPILLEGLDAGGDRVRAPRPEGETLDRAAALARAGELDRASQLLDGLERDGALDVHALRLLADLHRRERRGDEALAALAAARSAPEAELVSADLDLDEALVRMRVGELDRAEELYVAFLAGKANHPRLGEARFRLGQVRLALRGTEDAGATWRALVDESPEDRWAWFAACYLSGSAFATGRGPRPEWIDPRIAADARYRELAPLSAARPADVAQAEDDARRWLLERQRDDGSWISATEIARHRPDEPSEFVLAVTSVCGMALAPFARDGGATERAAVERALACVAAEAARLRLEKERKMFMDHRCWSRPLAVGFIAEAVIAGLTTVEDRADVMDALFEDVLAIQKPDGGFGYHVTSDLDNESDASIMPAMSFTTAADLYYLLRAKQAGFDVPGKLLAPVTDLLESNRTESGAFGYYLTTGAPRGDMGVVGNSCRGPVCTLALVEGGRLEVEALRGALDLFVEHGASLAAEAGKSLMHCGPGGVGSHYPYFDYFFAAESVARLPREQRDDYRAALQGLVLSARAEDGSYLDNPINGRAVCTGFALRTLWLLSDRRP